MKTKEEIQAKLTKRNAWKEIANEGFGIGFTRDEAMRLLGQVEALEWVLEKEKKEK